MIKYSVILPIKNEEENISVLCEEIKTIMNGLNEAWQLVCIDDGSTDTSWGKLNEFKSKNPKLNICLLKFKKNYGQTSAFDAGFKQAEGSIIITMDADLQNDPKDIPLLLEDIDRHDMVCGWRHNRHDSTLKKFISRVANPIRSYFCKDGVHDSGCSLKAFKKQALTNIKFFTGMHRFLPALFKLENLSVLEVKVTHRPRVNGKSKYHLLNRNFGPIIDMFIVRWMRKRKLGYHIIKEKK